MESTVTMTLKEYNMLVTRIDILEKSNKLLRDFIAKDITALNSQKELLRSKGYEPDDIKITYLNTKMDMLETLLKETKV